LGWADPRLGRTVPATRNGRGFEGGVEAVHGAPEGVGCGRDAGIGPAAGVQLAGDLVDVVRDVRQQAPQAGQLGGQRRRGSSGRLEGVRAGEQEPLDADVGLCGAGGDRLVLGVGEPDLHGALTAAFYTATAGDAAGRGRRRAAGMLIAIHHSCCLLFPINHNILACPVRTPLSGRKMRTGPLAVYLALTSADFIHENSPPFAFPLQKTPSVQTLRTVMPLGWDDRVSDAAATRRSGCLTCGFHLVKDSFI
jgi:hypothetical protein